VERRSLPNSKKTGAKPGYSDGLYLKKFDDPIKQGFFKKNRNTIYERDGPF
jgi:hypothetical protein